MAVDRKADHVGNHGGAYVDQDGQTKQFTYIDHDVKPKMSNYIQKETLEELNEKLREFRERMITEILAIPAVFANPWHVDFTVRGEDLDQVEWNETMLRDGGLDLNRLRDIHNLASKRQDFHKRGITL